MSETELIRKTVLITLQSLGYAPKCTEERITQAEALRILKPKRIGRNKLNTFVMRKVISAPKKELGSRNNQKTFDRKEIYELLNR